MDMWECMHVFDEAEADFERAMERYGVPFEEAESSPRANREALGGRFGCHCENGGSSLWSNWISPACRACRTGEGTGSLFVDLRCTKSCYFCFNANQPHCDSFRKRQRDITLELEQAHTAGAEYRFLAVTGGEPLLHKEAVVSFFERAGELYPGVHTRLYTNGDLLNEGVLSELAASGLSELRLSVKPRDFDRAQEHAYAMMEKAAALPLDVVVEVPVIPGALDEMKGLLLRADAAGARGVNLLEFCFPLHNAGEFAKRGLRLRKRPYRYLYDYWYNGGVPVARSESEALELMGFALRENLRVGVHYCSADNRNSAQINLQNRPFAAEGGPRALFPWMERGGDGFLRCVKAFGDDAEAVKLWAERTATPHSFNAAVPSVAFPCSCAVEVRKAFPRAMLGESVAVLEEGEDGSFCLREVGLRPLPA